MWDFCTFPYLHSGVCFCRLEVGSENTAIGLRRAGPTGRLPARSIAPHPERLTLKPRKQALIGLCPIGKFVFSHEDAMRIKTMLIEKLDAWDVRYADLESVLPDGMVRQQAHVAPVVRYFRQQQIDGLFLPHCNFGTEGAAGMIAKECGVPTLLWGPRDEAPLADGTRLRDSLCGTLATSGVLRMLRVAFSYIPNCRVEDPELEDGLKRFVRVARVVKSLRTMRIGQLGQRIDFFWTTIANEAELLERFGIQVQPLDLVEAIREIRARSEQNRAAYDAELAELKKWISFNHYRREEDILHNFALRDFLLEVAEKHDLDAFCVQTFDSIPNELHSFLQLGCSLVADQGYPVGPESDLHATIGSILLEAASAADERSFIPDITIRHPENDNAVLLWHTDAPLCLRAEGTDVKVDLPWILKGLPTGLLHFKLKDGPLTLCRFGGSGDDYRIGCGEGHTAEGPYTQESHTWMEVDDWSAWERQLAQGPYIHHCSCCYGHAADVLEEACRFVPGLQFERFGRLPHDSSFVDKRP